MTKAVLWLLLGVAACSARTSIEDGTPIGEGGGGASSDGDADLWLLTAVTAPNSR